MKTRLIALVFAALVATPLMAQGKRQDTPVARPAAEVKAPALTDVQRLQIQNYAQSIELAQLRAQQAQRDFDQAREQLGKLIQSLQVEGFELDLQQMVYVQKPDKSKK